MSSTISNTPNAFTVLDCIRWLQNPEKHPITDQSLIDTNNKQVYTALCTCTMKRLLPEEIYEINSDMYRILGLDKLYNIKEIDITKEDVIYGDSF